MVGCVIVHHETVVATGYHQKFGDKHAEVNAIQNLPAYIPTNECVLYVTLEPCSHYGKTPPCSDLIISKGFKTVVVACKDPNPLVAGSGINKLKTAGIEVITGVLEQQARELNKRFITFFEKKRPYYILKWAQTADGFISKLPVPASQQDNKISGPEAHQQVHTMRSEVSAIMVGKNTVMNDNPQLTTRLAEGKNPIRVFIDQNLEIPLHYNIYNPEAPTIIINALKEELSGTHHFVKINFQENVLQQISEKLYAFNIQSVLVEGGAFLLNDFIEQHLWDEALVFQNPNLNFGAGIKAPVFALKNSFELVGDDKLYQM
jgi:diaminohydroxyphosphoribosylaminopyrimidine deaminase/5-amino-6-(5-phosphoribosylamino)uracil reductase